MKSIINRANRMLISSKDVTPEVMNELVEGIIDEFDVHMIDIDKYNVTIDNDVCTVTFNYDEKYEGDYCLILEFSKSYVQANGCILSDPSFNDGELCFQIRKFNKDDFNKLRSILSFNDKNCEQIHLSNYIRFELGDPFDGVHFGMTNDGTCTLDIIGKFKSETQFNNLRKLFSNEHIEDSYCNPQDKRYMDSICINIH